MQDDVIYRQEAIDKFEPWLKVNGYNEGELNMLKAVLYELKCLPSAEPKRKKGKWIVDEKRFGDTDRHCSLCGAILEGDDWKWRNNYYCYHCGMRMERSEDGSD